MYSYAWVGKNARPALGCTPTRILHVSAFFDYRIVQLAKPAVAMAIANAVIKEHTTLLWEYGDPSRLKLAPAIRYVRTPPMSTSI